MFVGHFGVGLAGKAIAPRTSLGTLFLAAQLVDLLWPTLLLIGLEQVAIVPGITRVTPLDFVHYPISHSLLMGVVWAALFAGAYRWLRDDTRGAVVCAGAVVSHWILDLLTHRPDLPLAPAGGPVVGLGLWGSLWATLVVEVAIFGGGAWLYLRHTRARDRVGSIGIWGLLVFLTLIYAGNLFGEPPPSVTALAWVGQAQWLLVLAAYWIDRHRVGD